MAWARQERRDRVESRLAFATTEEVRNETQYFKDASFHYQLSQAEEKYRGALLLIHNRATSTLTERQSSSINDFETIVKTILQNIEDKLDFARVFAKQAEKSGHREVVEWWTKLIHMGEKLMSRAEEILGDMGDMVPLTYADNRVDMGDTVPLTYVDNRGDM